MALAIRIEEMLQLLRQVESDLSDEYLAESAALACECATIRSVAIALGDDSQGALSLAEDCLSRTNDPWTANVASNVARFGYLKAGDLTKFYATPWIPYSLDEDRRNVFASVYRRCLQGLAEVQQLRLSAAERYYVDAVALAEQHVGANSVAAALPFSLLAQIRYEQGRMDEAEDMLFERLPILSAAAMLDCVLSAYFVLVRLAVSRRNFPRAHTLLEQAENLGIVRGWGDWSRQRCSTACGSRVQRAKYRKASRALIGWTVLQTSILRLHPALGRTFTTIACWLAHKSRYHKIGHRPPFQSWRPSNAKPEMRIVITLPCLTVPVLRGRIFVPATVAMPLPLFARC
jgi:hypothetical protein